MLVISVPDKTRGQKNDSQRDQAVLDELGPVIGYVLYVMFNSDRKIVCAEFFTVNSIGHDYPSCGGVISQFNTVGNLILFAPFWGKFSTL